MGKFNQALYNLNACFLIQILSSDKFEFVKEVVSIIICNIELEKPPNVKKNHVTPYTKSGVCNSENCYSKFSIVFMFTTKGKITHVYVKRLIIFPTNEKD